jgi:O-succinylbenzoate synthase
MKITQIDIYHVHMPLKSPFRTAYGEDHAIESVLVRLSDGEHHGWGEASPLPMPTYSSEWSGGVFQTLSEVLAPRVLGASIDHADELQQRLAIFKGNEFAKSGLDMAWWDLEARRRGEPLWKTLGGEDRPIAVGADFGVADSIDILLGQIDAAMKAGFQRVKLKFKPGWDVDMVSAVRRAFPKGVFHIDCNGGFTLADAPLFKRLDPLGLAMIEQPLVSGDLADHARLARQIDTPICLDESIQNERTARQAVELGSCRYFNIKPPRVGGHTVAKRIHQIAVDAGVPCWVGSMLESGLGAGHLIALASLPQFRGYPADIFPSDRFYAVDLATPEVTLSGPSRVDLPRRPGCGFEPDPARLAAQTLRHTQLIKG